MEIIEKNKKNYDEFPYQSKSYDQTNPHRLKLVMALCGMETAPLENARVLEIGCSFGGNIIPFGAAHENAEVYGIDLSETQINKGKELVEKMGFTNIKLHAMNILEYKGEFGKFDYIICHGVFSWVPDIVKEKIIEVIKNSLSENGVAHISYNTYPGWKYIEPYREMSFFRRDLLVSQNMEFTESEVVAIGRGMAEFINQNTYLDQRIKDKKDSFVKGKDYYIYHEYFEPSNDPMYLYDFNEMLEKQGLYHVTDSNIAKSLTPQYLKEILENECGNDTVAKEQYVDFIQNCQFRNSLITHIENKGKINNPNDILISEFHKYYVRGKVSEFLVENPTELEKIIYEHRKEGILVKDLFEREDVKKDELLSSLIHLKYDLDLERPEKVSMEKVKLKPRYKNYFKTYSEDMYCPIGVATKKGITVSGSIEEIGFMLQFDGESTIDDIVERMMEKYRNKEINVTVKEGEEVEEVIRRYFEKCRDTIVYFDFCE